MEKGMSNEEFSIKQLEKFLKIFKKYFKNFKKIFGKFKKKSLNNLLLYFPSLSGVPLLKSVGHIC